MTRPRLRSALPEVFQTAAAGSPPLQALLTVADAMLGPVADVLDSIDVVADPYRSADHVAAALAWWVDLGWLTAADAAAAHPDDEPRPGEPSARVAALPAAPTRHTGRPDTQPRLRSVLPRGTVALRDLVAASPELAARRGTASGMIRFLELATGASGWALQVDPDDFHLTVGVPPAAQQALPVVTTIVETIKPAHVTASVHPLPAATAPIDEPAAPAPGPAPEIDVAPTEVIPVVSGEPGVQRNPFAAPPPGAATQPIAHTDPGSQH